ncbi:MAG: thioredoxin domain-containing protein [Anaerolineales bacterium]|nr:thioredoxin domain-containing protein [Anaerolineales bacterium]
MPNHLINSNSPYLLQHANNPVDWFAWGEEALSKAQAEDKPIFLSIGYAACHWCHVMERESFEDAETAAIMNEYFVNIKVDREERPDLDNIYMQATMALTGSGGWPMSVFLTPDRKPFFAGTYFPPERRQNFPSFKEVLLTLAAAWKEDRAAAEKAGAEVFKHLDTQLKSSLENALAAPHLRAVADAMETTYLWGTGGWGDAPKFPQPMALDFLLHHALVDEQEKKDEYIKLIEHALEAMARGGMYDVIGGGFSRYSTDDRWRVPHFEKMLYDNALLARVYLHAWQVTRNPFFKRVVEETVGFVANELSDSQGGFYSSLDADSEGEEGKFYVWTLGEIRAALKEDSPFFEAAYGIRFEGNWEGKTVLQRALDDSALAARFNLDLETVAAKIADSRSRLYAVRAARPRPRTDDKVLASWNGLMLTVLAEAARAFSEDDAKSKSYLELATRSANFLLDNLHLDGKLYRSWREGKVAQNAFLEDYASLILGLLELYQTDFNERWFVAAKELADAMLERFDDPRGGFFDAPEDAHLLFRPKDVQDNALPCGNSLACEALLKLAAYTGEGTYRVKAESALGLVSKFVMQYPLGFGRWLWAAQLANGSLKEVAVVSKTQNVDFQNLLNAVQRDYRPNVVVAATTNLQEKSAVPLLENRPTLDGKATVYVCERFACKQPTTDAEKLIAQLNA